MTSCKIPGFRSVPETGVIYVTKKASNLGFTYDNPEWANLGQGSPEVGDLPGAPPRITKLDINPSQNRYSSVSGNMELRQSVADFYNKIFREGKSSQYTYENVCIAGGGRIALSRLAAALGNINMGHFLPDYTAYEELLGIFKAFTPIPILLDEASGYQISLDELRNEVMGRGLRALLISNPCNPTGQVIMDDLLRQWVDLAREIEFSLIFDEFYSHYIYPESGEETCKMVSAAAFVEDVNEDPVIIVDGLTKNWRYPGWRMSWTVGPKSVIETVASAGSFLDGGANHPFQSESCALLDVETSLQETRAIQKQFLKKRAYLIDRLKSLDVMIENEPRGGFYIWANLSNLPEPINDGLRFFEEGLKEKIITVPGVFFDVNPSRKRFVRRYQNYCRVSFGPEMETLELGMDALERVIKKFK
ncbi:MAG: aspartate/methionine/tyrosine aminotransferase [Chlamydiales bacterium]|jgi:aspartate/methionine/tyrosine aminotransferase